MKYILLFLLIIFIGISIVFGMAMLLVYLATKQSKKNNTYGKTLETQKSIFMSSNNQIK